VPYIKVPGWRSQTYPSSKSPQPCPEWTVTGHVAPTCTCVHLLCRYAGLSTCFRREAGSHGKDTLGIFR
jgi:hypothetical protein